MSPPDTNLKVQKRRHRPVLYGIVASVLLAVVAWIAFSSFVAITDETGQTLDIPIVDTEPAAEE